MTIYTKKGDEGKTDMAKGKRVEKCDPEMQAVGELDELNAHLGLLLAQLQQLGFPQTVNDGVLLLEAQRTLFDIGALCIGAKLATNVSYGDKVEKLEEAIDRATAWCGPLFTGFVLPGGHVAAAECHVARTVCRRAERTLVQYKYILAENYGQVLPYVNRLSDFLYALAKKINFLTHTEENKW